MPRGRHTIPETIKKSPKRARELFEKALEGAEESYGEGRRSHQTAYAALKQQFHKVGDHWEPKKEKGPSDPRALRGAGRQGGRTYGGVDYYGSTRQELYERAKRVGVRGRSRMSKEELAEAVSKKQG